MWPGIKFSSIGEQVTKDDLLQFQTSLNRQLDHTLRHVRSSQILNLEANKITTAEAKITSAQIDTINANQINVTELSAISANLGTVTAGTINGLSINGAVITGGTINVTTDINVGERINLRLNDNDYAVFRNIVITGGSSLFIGRSTTKTGWPLGNLERVDMFAGILYVYNHLYASSSIDSGGSINFATNLTKNGSAITSSSNGSHSHSGSTNSAGSHNHGIPESEYVATYTSAGTFLGYRQLASDGSHSHSLSTDSAGSHAHTVT